MHSRIVVEYSCNYVCTSTAAITHMHYTYTSVDFCYAHVQHKDKHLLVLDLDETLVTSTYYPIANPDVALNGKYLFVYSFYRYRTYLDL